MIYYKYFHYHDKRPLPDIIFHQLHYFNKNDMKIVVNLNY